MSRSRVMVAGVAGASLGTEIIKSLARTGRYEILACDVSAMAEGLYSSDVVSGHLVDAHDYVNHLLEICRKHDVSFIVPGAERVLVELNTARESFVATGTIPVLNRSEVIRLCTNKNDCLIYLASLGVPVPQRWTVSDLESFGAMTSRYVVKPSSGSGGSAFVSIARNGEEALRFAQALIENGMEPSIQEYLPDDDGEFTVGTLRLDNGCTSIAMKRHMGNKLSTMTRSSLGVLSTGYSQGLIAPFPEVQRVSESVAVGLDSFGPLNVQGRLVGGQFFVFEVNPRFSATTYLRALAGWNEIDMFLQHLEGVTPAIPPTISEGFYLRTFSERYVPVEHLFTAPEENHG